VSEVDGFPRKKITGFIGDVYRFPNMLAENKNPTAYGADGEYSRQISSIDHPASSIDYPTLAHFRHFSHFSSL
jgi:hypothetical protein